ncbi:sulfurtransferase [Saxibacter everestensis]|uniref:Sulfurtransferase n=1 Tax=Saxibacter everestensis TaxID=2909229 RepID=A0ABY8QVA6_9MICO|nr:sulfurtransferase [Brevibacteriaceae bacterium ZFBP1038]
MTDTSVRESVLISAAQLQEELSSGTATVPVVLDVRWALGGPNGRAAYDAGHIPGAIYVDLESELTGHGRSASEGRHPLPDVSDFQAAARRWGISDDSDVVVYDQTSGMAAARLWWLLRWAGLRTVRVLDGGYPSWLAHNGASNTAPESPEPGTVSFSAGQMPTLSAEEAEAYGQSGVLLDARAGERYRGESEPIDPKAGHIPGAASAPTTENVSGQEFLPTEKLRARFEDLGVTDSAKVGAYCGSGITAAHEVLALAAIGVDAALYPASWSGWCSDDSRPVATGVED